VLEVELLLDCRATIGESPTWFAPKQALLLDRRRSAEATSAKRRWLAGAMALRRGYWRLRVVRGRRERTGRAAQRNLSPRFRVGRNALVRPRPFEPNLSRFNEGVCDADGRFWIGVMFDPRPGVTAERSAAPLHRFTFGGGLVAGDDWSDLHSGFAWSTGEDAFFLSHSHAGEVLRAPYDPTSGRLGKPSPFAEIRTEGHVPDGAAMDEDGCYWCAGHGGGVLHRYDPSGALIAQVDLPISQPTMCAFVGPRLEDIVVTSASEKLTEDQLKREPHAGGLFRLRPGVRGLPRSCIVR
jgi:sugar lactone lactonase YvrE